MKNLIRCRICGEIYGCRIFYLLNRCEDCDQKREKCKESIDANFVTGACFNCREKRQTLVAVA